MSTGLLINKANGQPLYNSDDVTWNFIGSFLAARNTGYSISIPNSLPEMLFTRHMVGQVTGDDQGIVHAYSWNGSTLTITAPDATNTVATFFMWFGR